MSRLRQALLGLGVVAVLAVVPVALVHLGGAPGSTSLARSFELGPAGWAWLAAWLGWVAATAAAARDLARALSRDPLVRARAGLIGAALAALITLATPAGASSSPRLPPAAAVAAAASARPVPSPVVHLVVAGESLWSVASEELGDGNAWPSIWSLNAGSVMADGRPFVDPSLIYPGWSLALPVEAPRPAPRPTPRAAEPRPPGSSTLAPGLGAVASTAQPLRWLPGGLATLGGSVLCLALLGSWLARRRAGLAGQVAAAWAALDDPLLDQLEAIDQLRSAPLLDRLAEAWAAVLELGLADEVLALGVGNAASQALVHGDDGPELVELPASTAAEELPALLCLGDDAERSWVAPLRAGRVVAFEGPGARQVQRAATAQLAWWPWTENLVVTADPALAGRELARRGEAAVVYTGQPGRLDAETLDGVAVVTAGLEPTSSSRQLLRCELGADGSLRVAGLELGRPDPPEQLIAHAQDLDAVDLPSPGGLEVSAGPPGPMVRLLVARPRLEGLEVAIAPERERKATELVAYLATHAPAEVPGDRLRARLLGRRDGDGTAKTLANVASVARRALGASRLPPAGVDAAYRVEGIATDLQLMAQLVAEGEASLDGCRRVALLREALGLVEAEPLSALGAGYAWWRSEGHAAQAAALACSAAWSLVDDAVGEGSVELARWGLAQARLLDQGSESLLRAEMVLAGIADDPDALRSAWSRCCDLDGGVPSAAAERTFATVSARLRARRG